MHNLINLTDFMNFTTKKSYVLSSLGTRVSKLPHVLASQNKSTQAGREFLNTRNLVI